MSCPGVSKFTAEELAELREFDAAIDAGRDPSFYRAPQKNLTAQEKKKRRSEYDRAYYEANKEKKLAYQRAAYRAKRKAQQGET